MGKLPTSLGIQQRILPQYRIPFFEQLHDTLNIKFELLAGRPSAKEGIEVADPSDTPFWRYTDNFHYFNGKLYFCRQRGLSTWLNDFDPDVVIFEANPRLSSNYAGIRWLKSRGKKVIGWGLGRLDWNLPKSLHTVRNYVLSKFYRQFDGLIAYSSKAANDFQSLGIAESRIFVAPNAVSNVAAEKLTAKLEKCPDLIETWRQEKGIGQGKFVLLFVGRLIAEKRVADLIEACVALKEQVQLVIVGDGPERFALEAQAEQKLPEAIFMGHQTDEALGMCFASADLFVLPGSGGLAMQEAMAFGKPILVAAGDGSQFDMVKEGKNGFHVQAGQIPPLTQKIEMCFDKPKRLVAMGEESRRIVNAKQNLNLMVEGFRQALVSVAE